jgi:MATE family multidrug resistance protein
MLRAALPWRCEFAATLALAWPLALGGVAELAAVTVVLAIAGHRGTVPLAGAALGAETIHFFFLLGLGFAIAIAPLLAEARGRDRHGEIPVIIREGALVTGLVAVPCVVVLWFIEPILLVLGQRPEVAAAAREFTRPAAFGLPAWLWVYVLRNALAAALDRPRSGLYVLLGSLPLQALLGHVLTDGAFGWPGMGLAGCGLSFALCGWALAMTLYASTPWSLVWRTDAVMLRKIARLGFPVSLALLFESSLFLVTFYLQGLISPASQAAHAVALQISAIPFMMLVGLGQATTIRLGLAFGRRDLAAGRAAVWVSAAAGLAWVALVATLYMTFPRTLLLPFLDSSRADAEQVLVLGTRFLAVAALFQLGDGGQVLSMACLRALQDTRVPMLIAAVGYWVVGLPSAALLGLATPLAGVGIWLGIAGGLSITALLLFRRLGHRLEGRAWLRPAD